MASAQPVARGHFYGYCKEEARSKRQEEGTGEKDCEESREKVIRAFWFCIVVTNDGAAPERKKLRGSPVDARGEPLILPWSIWRIRFAMARPDPTGSAALDTAEERLSAPRRPGAGLVIADPTKTMTMASATTTKMADAQKHQVLQRPHASHRDDFNRSAELAAEHSGARRQTSDVPQSAGSPTTRCNGLRRDKAAKDSAA